MDENTNDKAAKGKSLTEDQITSGTVSRRTMLRTAGLASLGAGTLAVSGCVVVPVGGTGFTDADNGPIIDPVGGGRGPRPGYRTGITDADNGPIVDGIGGGRGRIY